MSIPVLSLRVSRYLDDCGGPVAGLMASRTEMAALEANSFWVSNPPSYISTHRYFP